MLFRFQINIKNITGKKKQAKNAKKVGTGIFFFIFALQFPTFRDSFKVVRRAFHSESMTLLETELVPN